MRYYGIYSKLLEERTTISHTTIRGHRNCRVIADLSKQEMSAPRHLGSFYTVNQASIPSGCSDSYLNYARPQSKKNSWMITLANSKLPFIHLASLSFLVELNHSSSAFNRNFHYYHMVFKWALVLVSHAQQFFIIPAHMSGRHSYLEHPTRAGADENPDQSI